MDIKEVLLKDVKLGMCLAADVSNVRGIPLFQKGFYFTSREQIIRLQDEGLKSIPVNMTISLIDTRSEKEKIHSAEAGKKEFENPERRIEYLKIEKAKVKELYKASQDIINETMNSARFGKALEQNVIKKQAIDVLNSIKRDNLALLSLLNLKNFDEYTYTHSLNVAVLATAFAWHMKFPEDKLLSIGRGAFLHDIGKAKVPLSILNKPDRLDDSEFKIMQMHPSYGEQIYQRENMTNQVEVDIVLHHHESYDGSGYPSKQAGNEINKFAAIVSISDFYDALTTERVYKKVIHPSEAIQIVYSQSGKKFDPRVVNHFIKTVGIYPIGSLVELSNEQIAMVVAFSRENLLKPVVQILQLENGILVSQNKIISLLDSDIYIKSIYKGDVKIVEQNVMA
ncbi:MAG TPA: HD-GYP domain-containing protein [Candidatus Cloacimonadota bacterium]|nr:HD-GYP domain-containing protein [Candidatus Cloacimonadota bacterium]